MSWKNWPYWVKGIIISVCCTLLLATIISVAVAFSSICGFNSAGASHTCSLLERISSFGDIMKMLLILPFVGTFYSILEYHSLDVLWHATDGFPIMLIIIFILLFGGVLGWLYGKIKNRNKTKVS